MSLKRLPASAELQPRAHSHFAHCQRAFLNPIIFSASALPTVHPPAFRPRCLCALWMLSAIQLPQNSSSQAHCHLLSSADLPSLLVRVMCFHLLKLLQAPHAMVRKGDEASQGRCTPFLSIPFFLAQLKSQIGTCSNSSEANRVNVSDTFGCGSARLKSTTLAFYWLSCVHKLLLVCILLPTTGKPKQLQLLRLLQRQSRGWDLDSTPHGQNHQFPSRTPGTPMAEAEAAQKSGSSRNRTRNKRAEGHGCTTQKLRQPRLESAGLPAPANIFSHLTLTKLI